MDDILPPLSEEDKMLSGLCYPFWLVVPPLVLFGPRRSEPFVHFHALQSLALGVVSLVGALLLGVGLWLTFQVLPGSAPALSGVVGLAVFAFGWFVSIFYLSFLFYTAWRASAGRFLRLPLLGAWAEARMRDSLGLTDESYRTDPLPGVREIPVEEPPDPAELLRVHRPAPPRSLEAAPAEEPLLGMGAEALRLDPLVSGRVAPAEGPAEPEAEAEAPFQPGIVPPRPRSGRKFRWTPLEEEGPAEREAPDGSGFQAW